MNSFNCKFSVTFLLTAINVFLSCKQDVKSNQFNIYISENNSGWHFVDLKYDTLNKSHHGIEVKFTNGQTFQTAIITSHLNRLPTFLNKNGDTLRSQIWFVGEYTYDPLQRKFICFYVPTEIQRRTINDYMKDSSYDDLRYAMDTIVKNYLRQRKELK